MIGPVDSYQSIYVAICGREFTSAVLGRQHERDCPACRSAHIADDPEPRCDDCGKALGDFSDYGCGKCDSRTPDFGVE